MGLSERWDARRQRRAKRPRGGAPGRVLYVPPDPVAASGDPPPSPAEALTGAGAAPPRPLVWLGTAASGAAVWSSPVANGVGLDLWRDLRAAADDARVWPVLTGMQPLPSSWHPSAAAAIPGEKSDPVLAATLLRDAHEMRDVAPPGLRTRMEPSTEAVVEPALAAGYLALVTDVTGWQVPIAVGFDVAGWSAREHSEMLAAWHTRFGAELVALTEDSVALLVTRPPRTPEEAYDVAGELYAYCPDVVTHGLGTLWALATSMVGSPAWVLRWRI